MRKIALLLLVALSLLLVACTPEETSHALGVNAFRQANGVAPLGWDDSLSGKARAWSQHMADDGKLSHSDLKVGAPAGWQILGENVAMNSDVNAALTALENSPAHRDNLLNARFTRGAVGIVQAKGVYWVTEEFVG